MYWLLQLLCLSRFSTDVSWFMFSRTFKQTQGNVLLKSICLYPNLSIYQSVYCRSIDLSIDLLNYLLIYWSIFLCNVKSIYLLIYGSMDLWICRSKDLWIYGSIDLLIFWSMDLLIFGSMDLWELPGVENV